MDPEQSLTQPEGASESGHTPQVSMSAASNGTKRSAPLTNGDPRKRAKTGVDGFPPISPAKMQELKLWLRSRSNVKDSNQVPVGIHTQLLKSIEPPNQVQDLEDICRVMGVETSGLDWKAGIHIPGVLVDGLKVRPHQIIGANWICNNLDSPLRAALFADESGTGKTVQIGLGLAIHYHRIKAQVQAGTFNPRDEVRHFKPSIYACSPHIAYQTYREWKHWFGDFFNIQIYHGTKSTAPDPSIKEHIIDDYQAWVDENAEEHENIETLRTIAIVPFKTAVSRFLHKEEKVDKPKSDGNGTPKQQPKGQAKKKEINLKITGHSYNWVICDDVPAIRGPRQKTHKLIRELDDEATLGYVTLFWRRQWPLIFDKHDRIPATVYYDNKAWEAMKDGREFKGLTMGRVIRDQRTASTAPSSARDVAIRDEYVQYVRGKNGPLFLWYPNLFQRFREENVSLRPEIAQKGIQTLLEMFCLRRGMLTPSTMPGGEIVVPGEGIPRMNIRTIVLQPYNYKDKDDLYKIGRKHYPDLFADSQNKKEDIGDNTIDKPERKWIKHATLQTLTLSNTNVEFYRLTQKIDGMGKPYLMSKEVHQLLNGPPRLERLKTVIPSGQPTSHAAVTVRNTIDAVDDGREIENIVLDDNMGGLQWYLGEMNGDNDVEVPKLRDDIAKAFCSRTPKLCWTINRVLQLKEQNKSVLIFVNRALTAMVLTAVLTSLGVTTLNIRSGHSSKQRANMVQQFTSKNGADSLIVSFKVGGFGLNLQAACHHGIIVEYPDNLPTMLHSFGRLWRIGQKQRVHWDVLYLENSFDAWVDTRMASKYADILAAEGQIPDEIKGEYRVICGFELIKKYLGQDCNRYPRTRVTWSEQDHPLVTREGHFYSAVAEYLMLNPAHVDKFIHDSKWLSKVARRWTPEQGELTLDMIELRSQALADGVVLDSRNPEMPGYVAVMRPVEPPLNAEQAEVQRRHLDQDWGRLQSARERRI
ncbi:transcription regulatory SNF2 [Fusarium beomiforme]|uniref:Transcription regulatory SNF2 n=1 Tax=Fusarium beomiforme TaxID=44412 RepID=A0A9P5DY37_9HYPO|nr:transcription regulatory SNF2 [Fusarium beomiforme]